jgi:hypothetical protein
MSQENWSGGTLASAEPVLTHLPIDQTKESNRAGHEAEFAPFEEAVRHLRFAAAPSPVQDPDARMSDPIIGLNTRAATHPVAMTVRKGFEDIPNLGKKGPESAPSARVDPLQSMEDSPNYFAPTVRITPGAWDEALLRR